MNVLIVDDQTHIVEGIYTGIDWRKIGVGQVLKAYNAFEAKQVLKSKIVDLMLSDIEMPGESGLELFRWVQEKAYDVTCIFLTSHADFQYAKEAIRLGGYDYIVQPAKYEDIERSVTEAIQKLKSRRETEKYSSYGKLLYGSSDRILQALLKEGLSGKPASESDMVNVLNQFHIPVSKDSQIYLILIDILMDLNVNGAWDKPTLWFALSNIVSELFEAYGQRVLLIALDDQCFFIYGLQPRPGQAWLERV
ncbi:response regulator [Cohnella rhizosphaerae]|uniref:Response regulator n=1 Tax=Cohnella rhizosphaerae TaxID=1457232 RepID=A0A9X4KQA9_9BACL|nr:response regulator [Cohnella rhizosphaerae]MDG0808832.1 response regulator [Cohnella rhizosphaerae]